MIDISQLLRSPKSWKETPVDSPTYFQRRYRENPARFRKASSAYYHANRSSISEKRKSQTRWNREHHVILYAPSGRRRSALAGAAARWGKGPVVRKLAGAALEARIAMLRRIGYGRERHASTLTLFHKGEGTPSTSGVEA